MRNILVLGTGGTISCAKTEDGLKPAVSVRELVSGLNLPVEIHTEQLFNLDSTNMTARHWETVAARIRESYDEYDGFVVTHGTDTMAYAAGSLACLIQNPRKPVVLTGSMRPMLSENSDAPDNLRHAVIFAADERTFGVRVVFDTSVYDARSFTKHSSAFRSPFVNVNFACGEFFRGSAGSELVVKNGFRGGTRFYERLSDDVFLAKLIPGQKLIVPESARAVILEGYGLGGIPEYDMDVVERLCEKGVYIIISTQCLQGGTDVRRYEVGASSAKRFPLLEAGKMTAEYAVARARWALEYSSGAEEFQELFRDPDFF